MASSLITSGVELRPFLPSIFSKWVLTTPETSNATDYKSQAFAMGSPILLTTTGLYPVEVCN